MQKYVRLKVSLNCEFEAPKLVKVKAYRRFYNGKIVWKAKISRLRLK